MVADFRQFVEGLASFHAHHMRRTLADVHLFDDALALWVIRCRIQRLSVL